MKKFPIINTKEYNEPIGHFTPSKDSGENLSIFSDEEIQRMARFFNEGYEHFKPEDIAEDGYNISFNVYKDVIKKEKGIDTFYHSLQPITLADRCRWASGWRKARENFLAKKFSIENLKKDIIEAMGKHGVTVSGKYQNDLYLEHIETGAVFLLDNISS